MSFEIEMNNPLEDFRPESLCLLKESQEDYWRYARKGPHDFSVYTEKSSIYEPPAKVKFRESSDVLVRWTDGLLYLATIIQVEEEYSRCAVKFEDGSQFWALYKDIYKGPLPEGEIACTVCDSDSSTPPDEIVICDQCSVGYHQLCHIPKIDSSVLKPEISWSCRKCIFASAAKKGGALKKGTDAELMMVMKKTLPYGPQALTWDGSHRSNLQQTYCYCGGPGEWYSKMLQCSRCKQWFHEACIQCLHEPLLFGDRFYIFVCSVCNCGPEFVRRLPIRWPDIAHLVLFNLTVIHGRKFFDLESTIMSFLKDNWSQFIIKGESGARLPNEEKRKKMEEILQKSKSRFSSGKELKKKTYVWGLRSRVPPPTPVISIPLSGVITDEVLDSFNAASRKSKPVVVKPSSAPPVKKKRKNSIPYNDESANYDSDAKSHKSERDILRDILVKDLEDTKNKERRKLPHRRARYRKPTGSKTRTRIPLIELSDSEDTFSSLNSIIPHPTDFEGLNNPFLSTYKSSDISEGTTSSNSSSASSKSTIASTPTLRSTSSSATSKRSNLSTVATRSNVTLHVPPTSDTSGTVKHNTSSTNSTNATKSNTSSMTGTNATKSNVTSTNSTNITKNNILSTNGSSTTKSKMTSNSATKNNTSSTKSNITPSAVKNNAVPHTSKCTPTLRSSTLNVTMKSISPPAPIPKNISPVSTASSSTSKSTIRTNHRLRLRVRTPQKSPINKSQSVIEGLLNNPSSEGSLASFNATPATSPSSNCCNLSSSVSSYFGAADRIACGEKYSVLAKRIAPDGSVQYLVEWDGVPAS